MDRSEFVREALRNWSELRPADDLRCLGPIQRLIWSGRMAEELLERVASSVGFRRRGDYEVLVLLRRAQPRHLTPLDVSETLAVSPSGLTAKLDRLENGGLLKREADDRDRRAVRLVLTEAGRDAAERAFDVSLATYGSMLEGMNESDTSSLDELLTKVLERLDAMASMGDRWNR
jgi:DNA-binding MarR family transcriptional regulator